MHIDDDKQLEEEVVEIFKDAKATVNRQNIKKMDISSAQDWEKRDCHRESS